MFQVYGTAMSLTRVLLRLAGRGYGFRALLSLELSLIFSDRSECRGFLPIICSADMDCVICRVFQALAYPCYNRLDWLEAILAIQPFNTVF
jgi:hypothetical protein